MKGRCVIEGRCVMECRCVMVGRRDMEGHCVMEGRCVKVATLPLLHCLNTGARVEDIQEYCLLFLVRLLL